MRIPSLAIATFVLLSLSSPACTRKGAPGGSDGAVFHDAHVTDGAPTDGAVLDGGPKDGATEDGGVTPCHGYDLRECRLHSECAPDLCFTCSCTPTFEGCRHVGDPPFQCPEVECPQPFCCDSPLDCENMLGECAPPGTPYGCGMCTPEQGDCTAEEDCASSDICEPIPCSCYGESRCVPGCASTTEPCPIGTTCSGGDHPRCTQSTCSASEPCPLDFECDQGRCGRRPCTTDLQCDHFCVNGFCYEGQGECRQPAP